MPEVPEDLPGLICGGPRDGITLNVPKGTCSIRMAGDGMHHYRYGGIEDMDGVRTSLWTHPNCDGLCESLLAEKAA